MLQLAFFCFCFTIYDTREEAIHLETIFLSHCSSSASMYIVRVAWGQVVAVNSLCVSLF